MHNYSPKLQSFTPIVLFILFSVPGILAGFLLPLRVSISLRYELLPVLIISLLALWIAWKLPDSWNQYFSVFVIMALFFGALAALWRMGTNEVYEVFGLIPWFDSSGYYSGAQSLLDGGMLTGISARRPLFPAFFASLLFLFGRNLRLAISILTLIAGLSTWFLSREIYRTEKNAMLASAVAVLLFFYYRKFNGSILTETLGFTFGVIAVTFFWHAAHNRNFVTALVGLFCFTLGQLTRPGAAFSIFFLFLWLLTFSADNKKTIFKGTFSLAVIGIALLTNYWLTILLVGHTSSSNSNLSYQVYSMTKGGTGWTAIYNEHPELFDNSDKDFSVSSKIYELAWENFLSDPSKTLKTSALSLYTFFSPTPRSAFNYLDSSSTPRDVTFESSPVEFILRWSGNLLLILSIFLCLVTKERFKSKLLLALNAGVLFSLPIVTPWDVENMRAYAVSIPGILLGVLSVFLFFRKKFEQTPDRMAAFPASLMILLSGIIVFTVFIPIFLHLCIKSPSLLVKDCRPGEEKIYTQISENSYITIGSNSSSWFSLPHNRFILDLDHFPDAVIGQKLKTIPDNSIITQQNDLLQNHQAVWLVAPIDVVKTLNRKATYCGQYSNDERLDNIFYVKYAIE